MKIMLKKIIIKLLSLLNQRIIDKYIFKIPKYEKFPHRTHLPILCALENLYKFKNVLELGSGFYSTRAYLDKKLFPNIKKITSYEDNYSWYKIIKNKIKKKSKLKLIYTKNKIENIINKINLDNYDLIFVDNSMKAENRIKTIENIIKKKLLKQIVVIHDFEYYPYRFVAKIAYIYRFKCLTPNTGVMSNENIINITKLKKIDKKLRCFRNINDEKQFKKLLYKMK
jgi:hypothetical protein